MFLRKNFYWTENYKIKKVTCVFCKDIRAWLTIARFRNIDICKYFLRIPPVHALDVDSPLEFYVARFLYFTLQMLGFERRSSLAHSYTEQRGRTPRIVAVNLCNALCISPSQRADTKAHMLQNQNFILLKKKEKISQRVSHWFRHFLFSLADSLFSSELIFSE